MIIDENSVERKRIKLEKHKAKIADMTPEELKFFIARKNRQYRDKYFPKKWSQWV
jgi:hypothetical protein